MSASRVSLPSSINTSHSPPPTTSSPTSPASFTDEEIRQIAELAFAHNELEKLLECSATPPPSTTRLEPFIYKYLEKCSLPPDSKAAIEAIFIVHDLSERKNDTLKEFITNLSLASSEVVIACFIILGHYVDSLDYSEENNLFKKDLHNHLKIAIVNISEENRKAIFEQALQLKTDPSNSTSFFDTILHVLAIHAFPQTEDLERFQAAIVECVSAYSSIKAVGDDVIALFTLDPLQNIQDFVFNLLKMAPSSIADSFYILGLYLNTLDKTFAHQLQTKQLQAKQLAECLVLDIQKLESGLLKIILFNIRETEKRIEKGSNIFWDEMIKFLEKCIASKEGKNISVQNADEVITKTLKNLKASIFPSKENLFLFIEALFSKAPEDIAKTFFDFYESLKSDHTLDSSEFTSNFLITLKERMNLLSGKKIRQICKYLEKFLDINLFFGVVHSFFLNSAPDPSFFETTLGEKLMDSYADNFKLATFFAKYGKESAVEAFIVLLKEIDLFIANKLPQSFDEDAKEEPSSEHLETIYRELAPIYSELLFGDKLEEDLQAFYSLAKSRSAILAKYKAIVIGGKGKAI